MQDVSQGVNQERLGQTRHSHQERVPSCKNARQQFFYYDVLADDDLSQLLAHPSIQVAKLVNCLNVGFLGGGGGRGGCHVLTWSKSRRKTAERRQKFTRKVVKNA